MAIEDNPESRLRYGEELRARREGAGLTQEELSVRAIMSRTHIAHIEAGRRRPAVEDARRLDDVLEAGGVLVRFLPSVGEGRVAERFAEAMELEKRATMLRTYAPKLVPGLLQTKAYAHGILSTWFPPKSADERDALRDTRLARAKIFDDFESPVAWYLLDEAVLRRPVGGPAVMCEQLRHIANLGDSGRIRVHVLPFAVGPHNLLEGFVTLMWFSDLPPVAYVEGLNTGMVLENPSVVRNCQVSYEHALGDALSHNESLALLRSVADDYEHGEQS
ncbi:helix-turn-helix domain-containing protein [Streptomyces sp. p1417]|uniref:Helix-turn-helix domain-containing protein n=1 Tax=Streptomyces typhae TaxID=2681492 RepID=A0A6L6WYT2_9ACTN|nr:helix-turn-helix domain-containing protein [Streptomyces typhae]